jgi:hypothetical protein
MRRTEATAWVVGICAESNLRLSQIKTLAFIVSAALVVERVSLANLGRCMQGMVKHQIKRCWRFCSNKRIETADAMEPFIRKLLKKRKKPLLVALDWVDVRGFQTLVASAVLKGRSLPLCWASTTNHVYEGHRSRNDFEEALLLVLRKMIPLSVETILLADRGFGRTALAKFCQNHGFGYLIRIQPNVVVRFKQFKGKLLDYQVRRGTSKVLHDSSYRSDGAVLQHVVIHWARNLPKGRDECWFLMTDQGGKARQLCELYSKRMTIEQLFRDQKNKRNGWSLRDTRLTKPERLDRLLLILAVAYMLLCGVGLLARRAFSQGAWCSTNKGKRGDQCSIVLIGRIMLAKLRASPQQAFAAVIAASEDAMPNWG